LFEKRAKGQIEFFTSEKAVEPKTGDIVVSFSPPAYQQGRIQEKIENNRLKMLSQSKE